MTIYKPAQSSDDCTMIVYEIPFDVTLNGTSLIFGSGAGAADYVGIRFTAVNIPQGSTITSAKITFRASSSESGAMSALRIEGEDTDNALTFTTAAFGPGGYISRPRTTAYVNWTPGAWVNGSDYDSLDISTIIKEIVDRPGWVSGNNIVLLIGPGGSNHRDCVSYDSSTVNCARLEIITTAPGPTMDQIMKHGKWFNGGTFQGFWLGWR